MGEFVEIKDYLNEHYGKIPSSREILKTYKDIRRNDINTDEIQDKSQGPKKILTIYRKGKDGGLVAPTTNDTEKNAQNLIPQTPVLVKP